MNKHDEELHKYQTAYDLLMEYWHFIPDVYKPELHQKLKELGL
mgnify:CR=1 FL=1